MRLLLYVDMTQGMKWIGKLAGGLIGLPFGPVGVAIGVLLGHQFDLTQQQEEEVPGSPPPDVAAIGERFFRATFRVMGYLAKADGRVSEREISAARGVMSDLRLNPQQIQAAITYFTAGKQADFDPAAELGSLRFACQGRPELLRVFLEIQVRAALGGNNMEGPVRNLLNRVANSLGVSPLELAQIEAVLRIRTGAFHHAPGSQGYSRTNGGGPARASTAEQLDQAYKVLETTPNASKAE